jgi:hypothetical protein
MSHKKHRVPYRRHLRLGSGLEQIEPRLLLSATVEPAVQMGPPAPGGQGGFLDLGRAHLNLSNAALSANDFGAVSGAYIVEFRGTTFIVRSNSGLVEQSGAYVVDLNGTTLIVRPGIDRGPAIVPPPSPSKSPGGGFIYVPPSPPGGSIENAQEEVTVMAKQPRLAAANAPPSTNLGAALQLQPARGQANAFQLASSSVPDNASTIQRVAPPLPGAVSSATALPNQATPQASLRHPSLPPVSTRNAEELHPAGVTIQLASAVETQIQSGLDSFALDEPGHEFRASSTEAPAESPNGIAAEDPARVDLARAADGHLKAPGTSLVMASATVPNDAPSSQTAMVVTLAILIWQAGTAYFLPAEAGCSRFPQGR